MQTCVHCDIVRDMNTKLKELASKAAAALHGGDSKAAIAAGQEYIRVAIEAQLQYGDNYDDQSPTEVASDAFDHAVENLEVEVMDGLVQLIPDAEWNEDENQALVSSFLPLVQANRERVIDDFADEYGSERDPYKVYGVKPSDF